MAARRVGGRGRVLVAGALAGFLVVMAGVVWRRALGFEGALRMRTLEARAQALDAARTRLRNEIRSATSFGRLQPVVAARLGMRVPNDSQVIRLPRPAAPGAR